MTNKLKIIKETGNSFWHIHNDEVADRFNISDFETTIEGNIFIIVEIDGARRYKYAIQNITIIDKTGSGLEENFIDPFDFFKRLISIQYTPFAGGAYLSQNGISGIITDNGQANATDKEDIFTFKGENGLTISATGKEITFRQTNDGGSIVDGTEDQKGIVEIATDEETQIDTIINEDNKVVSPLKLYNWWEWTRTEDQNIPEVWNFENGVKSEKISGLNINVAGISNDRVLVHAENASGRLSITIGANLMTWSANNNTTTLTAGIPTKNNDIRLQDKSGIVAFINDFVKTAAGTTTTPPLIIPKGTLNTVPQDGAVERDDLGNLHHVVINVRRRILDTRDVDNFLTTTYRTPGVITNFLSPGNVDRTRSVISNLPRSALGTFELANYLFKTFDRYLPKNSLGAGIPPKSLVCEMHITGSNCKFNGKDSFRIYSVLRTDITQESVIRSYEIPMNVAKANSAGKDFSRISFSELSFDELGNVISETYNQLNLQTLGFTGSNAIGDMLFSEANLSLNLVISSFYDDPNNDNGLNASVNPAFYNQSTIFIKI